MWGCGCVAYVHNATVYCSILWQRNKASRPPTSTAVATPYHHRRWVFDSFLSEALLVASGTHKHPPSPLTFYNASKCGLITPQYLQTVIFGPCFIFPSKCKSFLHHCLFKGWLFGRWAWRQFQVFSEAVFNSTLRHVSQYSRMHFFLFSSRDLGFLLFKHFST